MHVLIVTGGKFDYTFSKQYIKTLSIDKVFAVDRGLEYVDQLNLQPEWIIGDFDTVNQTILKKYEEMIENHKLAAVIDRHPARKDASDTELAVEKAVKCGATHITILAGTGSRLDHVFANLNVLWLAEKESILCQLVDSNNRIQLLSSQGRQNCKISKETQWGKYVSFIAMSEQVKGFTLEGMAYPLDDAIISQGSSLTVSNEIEDEYGKITVKEGNVWIIESRD
ncbi:MAG: thiamine diphosphokinase [Eubacteriales bacterium]|nr:thiamine diphosphokinase [Eubacteriales bacterium]